MAGEQSRINGNTHVSTNLLLNSAGFDNLRSFFTKKEKRTHFIKMSPTWAVHFALFEDVTPRLATVSISGNVLPIVLASKSGLITVLP